MVVLVEIMLLLLLLLLKPIIQFKSHLQLTATTCEFVESGEL